MPADDERSIPPITTGQVDPVRRAVGRFAERTGVPINDARDPVYQLVHSDDARKGLRGLDAFHRTVQQAGRTEEYRGQLEEVASIVSDLREALGESRQGRDPMSKTGLAITKMEAELIRINQRLDKTLNPPESGGRYDDSLSDTRSSARVARSYLRGGNELPEKMSREFREQLEVLDESVNRLQERYMGDETMSAEERRRLSMEIASKSNLAQELRNILEYHAKENKNSLDSVMSLVGNIAGTLGLGALASSMFIQDPHRFRFTPAMDVMGQQGEVGAALSSALMQEEQYDIERNQQGLMAGLGATGVGVGMMRMGMGVPGAIMAGTGATLSVLGASGKLNDLMQTLNLRAGPDEIIGQNLATQLADPQRLLGHFQRSRAGLFAMGGGRAGNFGYALNDQARTSITGNRLIDEVMQREGGMGVEGYRRLGMEGADVGEMLSTIATTVVGSPGDFAEFVAQASAGFGMDNASVTNLLATAQRGGSRDAISSVETAMGATADREGRVSDYAMKVLVPALMRVTESMAVRNIARNSEELEREVYSLRSSMGKSENNLGRLINTNPEAFSRVMQTIETGVKGSLNDPARLAFDMMLGNNVGDILQGRASVMGTRLDALMNMFGGSSAFQGTSFDQMVNNPYQLMMLQNMAGISGIEDEQMLFQLMQMRAEGTLLTEGGELSARAREVTEGGAAEEETEVERRAKEIINTELGGIMESLAGQSDAMQVASNGLISEIVRIQDELTNIIKTDELLEKAKASMQTLVDTALASLGLIKPDERSGSEGPVPGLEALPHNLPQNVMSPIGNAALAGMLREGGATSEQLENPEFMNRANAALRNMQEGGAQNIDPANIVRRASFEYATGGFTGRGGRTDVAGVVHGGEYVISDNYARENKEVLDRIQSGENVQRGMGGFNSSVSDTGTTTTLTIRMSGMDVNDIYNVAQKATEDYVVRNRIIYD